MGFGLLFIGYFMATLMTINKAGFIARLVGYALVIIASRKLSRYNRSFVLLICSSILMLAVSVMLAISDVSKLLYDALLISVQPFGETYVLACAYAEMIMFFLFNATLLYALRAISIETGVLRNAAAALRNLIFVCSYFVLYVLSRLPVSFAKYLSLTAVMIYFFFIVLNLILIFSCYARICDECDVDMERKPSRFAFVNKMREESERHAREAAERHVERRNRKRRKK